MLSNQRTNRLRLHAGRPTALESRCRHCIIPYQQITYDKDKGGARASYPSENHIHVLPCLDSAQRSFPGLPYATTCVRAMFLVNAPSTRATTLPALTLLTNALSQCSASGSAQPYLQVGGLAYRYVAAFLHFLSMHRANTRPTGWSEHWFAEG